MSYDQTALCRIVEGALLAAGEALPIDRLLDLFEENERPDKKDVQEALVSIQGMYEGRGFELTEVASGWRFQVASDLAYWVNRLWEEKPQKYSRALLETLSLIAYRQPITRSDIEEVRGVAVSSHIIKTLAEREWIKVVGHRDVPGRPSLYATTRQFLDYFGLKSLEELPSLSELKDIDGLNQSLQLDEVAEEKEQIAEAQTDQDGVQEDDSESDSAPRELPDNDVSENDLVEQAHAIQALDEGLDEVEDEEDATVLDDSGVGLEFTADSTQWDERDATSSGSTFPADDDDSLPNESAASTDAESDDPNTQ